jgi:hypothetical protein
MDGIRALVDFVSQETDVLPICSLLCFLLHFTFLCYFNTPCIIDSENEVIKILMLSDLHVVYFLWFLEVQ